MLMVMVIAYFHLRNLQVTMYAIDAKEEIQKHGAVPGLTKMVCI